MIRNVVLLDGTWNTPRSGTNVCKLASEADALAKLILPAKDGIKQNIKYFKGVGSGGLALQRILGGAIGLGLRKIVQDAYNWVVENYEHDQELYIYGFSRGAYAARALAGLIGASGIQKSTDPELFEIMWTNYRARKAIRSDDTPPPSGGQAFTADAARALESGKIHSMNRIKCLGVWDTVGSYGVPAGVGLAALARYISLAVFGFQDTKFGKHIDHGLHAIGVDERRRPFTPTFWTVDKGHPQPKNVEQTWFAGVHCNVGGGYPDKGLSDLALLWMIARTRALTELGFDVDAVKTALHPDIDGEIYNSAKGWLFELAVPTQPSHVLAGRSEPWLFHQCRRPKGRTHQRARALERACKGRAPLRRFSARPELPTIRQIFPPSSRRRAIRTRGIPGSPLRRRKNWSFCLLKFGP